MVEWRALSKCGVVVFRTTIAAMRSEKVLQGTGQPVAGAHLCCGRFLLEWNDARPLSSTPVGGLNQRNSSVQ